ncbi:MAG: hypothetical protein R3Y24_00160 [Eubacteriales bacterium]
MAELLDIIRNYRMQYTLNGLVLEREKQLKEQRKTEQDLIYVLKSELTEEQFLMLSRYLDIQNYMSAEYGEVAYELGLRDGANLMKELEDLAGKPVVEGEVK